MDQRESPHAYRWTDREAEPEAAWTLSVLWNHRKLWEAKGILRLYETEIKILAGETLAKGKDDVEKVSKDTGVQSTASPKDNPLDLGERLCEELYACLLYTSGAKSERIVSAQLNILKHIDDLRR